MDKPQKFLRSVIETITKTFTHAFNFTPLHLFALSTVVLHGVVRPENAIKRCFPLLLAFLCSPVLSLYSAVPQSVVYQGKLSDASGNVKNGSFDFRLRLYDASTSGTLLLSDEQAAVSVTNGVYTLSLGQGTLTPGSASTLSGALSGSSVYLEIEVKASGDPSYETLSPRIRLESSPYALRAEKAEQVSLESGDFTLTIAGTELLRVTSSSTIVKNILDLQNNRLINLASPSLSGDAATKGYVDSTTGGLGAALLISTQTFSGGNVFSSWSVFSGSVTALNALNRLAGDGSAITGLDAGNIAAGQLSASLLDSSSVTLQGNSFNQAGRLLLLDGSALVSLAQIPSLPAGQITSGTFGDSFVAISTAAVTSGKFADDRVAISTAAVAQGKFGDDKVAISPSAVTGLASELSRFDQVATDTTTIQGSLSGEIAARAALATAVASDTTTLKTSLDAETSARGNLAAAVAADTTTLKGDITAEATARGNLATVVAVDTTSLRTSLTAEEATRAALATAVASDTTTLKISLDAEVSNRQALASAVASDTTTLKTSVDTNAAQGSANAAQLTQVASDTTTLQGSLTNEIAVRAALASAVAVDTTSLRTSMTAEETTRANLAASVAVDTATLKTSLDAETANRGNLAASVATDTTTLKSDITTEAASRQALATAVASDTTTLKGEITAETADRDTLATAVAVDTTSLRTSLDAETSARGVLAASVAIDTTSLRTSLTAEETARATLATAVATDTTTLKTSLNAESTARSALASAVAADTTTLKTSVDSNAAQASANAARLTQVASDTTTLKTSLDAETAARSTLASTVAVDTTTLKTSLDAETSARGALATAVAADTTTLKTSLDTETSARGSLASAVAADTTTLKTELTAESTARSTLASSVASDTTTLKTSLDAETSARSSLAAAVATDTTTLKASVDANAAQASANAARLTQVASDTTTLKTSLDGEASARGALATAVAADTTTLKTQLTAESTARSALAAAVAADTTTLKSDITAEAAARQASAAQVAADTSTLRTDLTGESAARAALASGVAADTTTLRTDVGANASRLTQVASDTSTLKTGINANAAGLTQVASDTTTLKTDIDAKVSRSGDSVSGQLTVGSTLTVTGNAFSVGGSTFIVKAGNVGIGASNPSDKLEVNGSITLSGSGSSINMASFSNQNLFAGGRVRTNAGVFGGLGVLPLGGTDLAEDARFASGNLGIGTTAPTRRLHVEGGIVAASSITAQTFFGDGFNLTGVRAETLSDSVTASTLTAKAGLSGIRVSTGLFVTAGNVGIGTAVPLEKLHLLDGRLRLEQNASGTLNGIFAEIRDSASTKSDKANIQYFGVNAGLQTEGNLSLNANLLFDVASNTFTFYDASLGAANLQVRGGSFPAVRVRFASNGVNPAVVSEIARFTPTGLKVGSAGGPAVPLHVQATPGSNGLLMTLQEPGSAPNLPYLMRFQGPVGTSCWDVGGTSDGRFQIIRTCFSPQDTPVLSIDQSSLNVGIATAAPTEKLHVSGNILSDFGMIASTATIGGSSFDSSGALAMASNAGITLSGGELLGLPATPGGLTAAASKAYVDNTLAASGGGWTDTGSVVRLTSASDSIGASGGTSAGVTFSSHVFITPGNVGIGTSNPLGKLHVTGDIFSNGGDVLVDDGRYIRHSNNWSRIQFNGTDVGSNIQFYTNASARAVIDGSGNLGIGTASPTHKLRVEGGILASSSVTASSFHGDGSDLTGVQAQTLSDSVTASTLTAKAGLSGVIVSTGLFVTAGNVGIGTANPVQQLEVASNAKVGGTHFALGAVRSPTYSSVNAGDSVTLMTDTLLGQKPGSINITAGNTGNSDSPHFGGNVILKAGTNPNFGGQVSSITLTGSGGVSGSVLFGNIVIGAGLLDAGSSQNDGGSVFISGGSFPFAKSKGGSIVVQGGRGFSGGGNVGRGGNIEIASGNGGTSNPVGPGGDVILNTGSGSSGAGAIRLRINSSERISIDANGPSVSGKLRVTPDASSDFSLFVSSQNGAGLFIVDKTGNAGIGTTSPGAKLEIGGGDLYLGNDQYLRGRQTGGSAFLLIGMDNSNRIHIGQDNPVIAFFTGNTAEKMRIDSSGNVGIATAAPQGLLHVGAGATPGLLVTSAGNVGIGTTAPSSKLDVFDGSITVRGTNAGISVAGSPVLTAATGASLAADQTFAGQNSFSAQLTVSSHVIVSSSVTANSVLAAFFAPASGNGNGVTIKANDTTSGSGAGGRITMNAGNNTAGLDASGGSISLTAGKNSFNDLGAGLSLEGGFLPPGNGPTTHGGHATLSGGDTSDGAAKGGDVILQAGRNTNFGNFGSALTLQAAQGSGSGGNVTLAAGNAGVNTPGTVTISGGDRTGGSAGAGGTITLQGGSGFSGGSRGSIILQTSGGNVGIASSTPQGLFVVGSATMVVTSAGNVGIGTDIPQAQLEVNGRIRAAAGADIAPAVQIGDSNSGIFRADTQGLGFVTAGGERMRINNSGNVGLGTTSPSSLLDVFNGSITVRGTNAGISVAGSPVLTAATGASLAADQTFAGQNSFSAQMAVSSHLFVSAGNVGIGTTNPTHPLHVRAASGGDLEALNLHNSTSGSGPGVALKFSIASASNQNGKIVVTQSGSSAGSGEMSLYTANVSGTPRLGIFIDRDGKIQSGSPNVSALTLQERANLMVDRNSGIHGSGPAAVFTGGGVGIGTQKPQTSLDVAGDAQFGSGATKSTFTNAGNLQMPSGGSITIGPDSVLTSATGAKLSSTQTFTGQNAFSAQMTVSSHLFVSAGNVGIGTASPTDKLHVVDGTVEIRDATNSTNWQLQVVNSNDSFNQAILRPEYTGSNDPANLYLIRGSAGPANTFHVKGTGEAYFAGNIGIGTETPGTGEGFTGPNRVLEIAGTASTVNAPVLSLNRLAAGQVSKWNIAVNSDKALTFYDVISGSYAVRINQGAPTNSFVLTGAGDTSLGGRLVVNGTGGSSFAGNVGIASSTPQGLFVIGAGTMVVTSGGNVGIGTADPAVRLTVSQDESTAYTGSASSSGLGAGRTIRAANYLGGANTASGIEFLNANGSAFSYIKAVNRSAGNNDIVFGTGNSRFEMMRIDSTGNVGVGTDSPAQKLHVSGGGSVSGVINNTQAVFSNTSAANSISRLAIVGGQSGGAVLDLGVANDSDFFSITLDTQAASPVVRFSIPNGTGGTSMAISNTGNVGVGTTSPSYKLHVVAAEGDQARFGTGTVDINLSVDHLGAGNADIKTPGNHNLHFGTNNGRKLTVLNAGNVGVGTTAPSSKLDVFDGSITVRGTGAGISVDGSPVLTTATGASLTATQTFTGQNAFSAQMTVSSHLFVSAGNVGIGTTNPGAKMQVVGGDIRLDTNAGLNYQACNSDASIIKTDGTNSILQTCASNGSIILRGADASNTEFVRIRDNGKLGVGADTPQGRLEVKALAADDYSLFVSSQNGSARLAVHKGGNVGIGTTAPGNLLHLSRAGSDVNAIVESTTGGAENTGINIKTPNGEWRVGSNILGVGAGKFGVQDFSQAGAEGSASVRLNITGGSGGGQVGIGVFNPGSRLSVSGNASIGSAYGTTAAPADGLIVQGNVGIGTAEPFTILRVTHGFGRTDTSLRNTAFFGSTETASAFPFGLVIRAQGAAALTNRYVDLQTTDFNSAAGGSLILQSGGGNVGIGTTAPDYPFQVSTDDRVTIQGLTANKQAYLHLRGRTATNTSDGGTVGSVGVDNSAGNAITNTTSGPWALVLMAPALRKIYLGDATAASMTVDTNTRFVGIGTAAPTARLHVVDGDIRLSTTTPSTRGIFFADGTFMSSAGVGSASSISNVTDAVVTGDSDANSTGIVILRTGASDRLTVANSGNIGIGTTSPGARLQVVGASNADGILVTGPAPAISISSGGASNSLGVASVNGQFSSDAVPGDMVLRAGSTGVNTNLILQTGTGDSAMYIQKGTNNVGIGTAAPGAKLHVIGGASNGVIIDNNSDTNFLAFQTGGASKWTQYLVGNDFRFADTGADRVTLQSGGNVGISTTNPQGLFVVGSGTLTVTSAGKVGIGTSDPSYPLDVLSTGFTVARFIRDSGGAQIMLKAAGQGADANAKLFRTSGGILHLGKLTDNEGVFTSQLAINNSGNVGIGTTAPLATLHISTSGASAASIVQLEASTNFAAGAINLELVNTDPTVNNWSRLYFSDAVNGNAAGGMGMQFTDHANDFGDLAVFTRGSGGFGERVRVTGAGNVGIGTTNPVEKLHVEGTAKVGLNLRVGGGSDSGNSTDPAITSTHTKAGVFFQNFGVGLGAGSTSKLLFLASDGNVGVGTSAPSQKLEVAGGAIIASGFGNRGAGTGPALEIGYDGEKGVLQAFDRTQGAYVPSVVIASSITFQISGVEKMRLDGTGNVGIGTTNPSAKLHVVDGDIKISTTSGSKGIVFADGTTQTTAAGTGTFNVAYASGTNQTNDVNPGYTSVAGSTVTLSNVRNGSRALVAVTGNMAHGVSGWNCQIRVLLDGTTGIFGADTNSPNTGFFNVSFTTLSPTLSSGSHNFVVQIQEPGGAGTCTLTNSGTNWTINVIEMPL